MFVSNRRCAQRVRALHVPKGLCTSRPSVAQTYPQRCLSGGLLACADEHGFNVFTLIDCTATTSREAYAAAVRHTFPLFSQPIVSSAIRFDPSAECHDAPIATELAVASISRLAERAWQQLPSQVVTTIIYAVLSMVAYFAWGTKFLL